MYLKRIHNVNVGPIEDAEINFPFDEENNPKPVIIVGENGTGKSVLLSNIVDSFYEFASKAFSDAVKRDDSGLGSQYYKIVTGQEIHHGKEFMYSWIEYEDKDSSDKKATYLFRTENFTFEKFCEMENIIDEKYLLYFVKNQQFILDGIATMKGTAGQQRISRNFVVNYLLPLPPFAEQKRIVERLEKLLPLC